MTTLLNRVRRAFYMDSVALMRLSRAVAALPGVERAALMIGSETNKALMSEAGLLDGEGREAGANDLIIAVKAEGKDAAASAIGQAETLLDQPVATDRKPGEWNPRSLDGAVQQLPDANLALISVPGAFAAAEARKALNKGLHVMMFSDNVSLEDEVSLKQEARARGLLMMGPDCGTAIIAGTPLAFANAVPRGDIGIVAASGTGLQEVSTLIARNGGGISHAIGVGGRDLKASVGGIMTLMGIDALDKDPNTGRIVLISKPPEPKVARAIMDRVKESRKRFTICFIGLDEMAALPPNAAIAPTLRAAAEDALGGAAVGAGAARLPAAAELVARIGGGRRRILGLYSGGTLCAEAQIVLRQAGAEVASNAPVPGAHPLDRAAEDMHRMLDLGADEYTVGRPHPMIDPSIRNEMLEAALSGAEGDAAVVLLDVVIGYGAHADPAGALVAELPAAKDRKAVLLASVCGTEDDPQVYSRQVETLREAGVVVAPSNAHAAELALAVTHALA